MATPTPRYNLPQYERGDSSALAAKFNAMMVATENAIGTQADSIVAKTTASGTGLFTVTGGWTFVQADAKRVGDLMSMTIVVTNNAGFGVANVNPGTVAVGWRPPVEWSVSFRGNSTHNCVASINTGGALWVQNLGTAAAGVQWRFSGVWLV